VKQGPTIKTEKEQRSAMGMCGGEDRSPPPSHQSHPRSETFTEKNQERSIYPATHETARSEFHSHHPPSPTHTFHLLNYHSPNTPPPVTHGARTRTHPAEKSSGTLRSFPSRPDICCRADKVRGMGFFQREKAWAWPLIHLPALHHISRLS
jgi:hypothetical protein